MLSQVSTLKFYDSNSSLKVMTYIIQNTIEIPDTFLFLKKKDVLKNIT